MPTLTAMPPLRQRGIVLMVALVMLVTITLLAIMTLGSATTEQRIAATDQFRNMGFQGAESAIEGAMTDVGHLSAALTSSTGASRTLNLGTTPVTATALTTYLGDSPCGVGWSLGTSTSCSAYHFLIQGTGTAGASGVNLSAVTAQGVFRRAPSFGSTN